MCLLSLVPLGVALLVVLLILLQYKLQITLLKSYSHFLNNSFLISDSGRPKQALCFSSLTIDFIN